MHAHIYLVYIRSSLVVRECQSLFGWTNKHECIENCLGWSMAIFFGLKKITIDCLKHYHWNTYWATSQSSKPHYIQLPHNISLLVRSLTFQVLLQFRITTLNWLVVWSVALWRIQQWWYIINSHEWCSGPLWSIYHLCCKIKSFSHCVQLTWTRWVKLSCFSCDHQVS